MLGHNFTVIKCGASQVAAATTAIAARISNYSPRGLVNRRMITPWPTIPAASLFSFLDYSKKITQKGYDLIQCPNQNKGLAFTEEERIKYRLKGLLPAGMHNQAHQVKLAIEQIREFQKDLNKYIYLRDMQDNNKQLFYRVLQAYPDELMPIVYTPVVGLACQHYSRIYKRPRGLFITINDAGNVNKLFKNWEETNVRAIVVTDGERTLGLGDQGAHGMGISVGKMALYTAIGGIPPQLTLPVCIDVGTNNTNLLNDPYYIGLHRTRVKGEEYDALIDEFMQCVAQMYGNHCLVQFEDFGNHNASRLLQRYRDNYCVFNDDIQGTAAVTLSGIFSFNRITDMAVSEHTFLFQGAGTAATGIADLIVEQMKQEGLSEVEAHQRIWMRDIDGLVTTKRPTLRKYAKNVEPINDLEEVVRFVKPTCLVGVSAQTGAFSKSILEYMAEINGTPLILSLSNPTSKSECTAEQAYRYTNGRCMFASGSPFAPVTIDGKEYDPSQGNNAYIFPAMALSVMACGARRISDQAFIEAAKALAEQLNESEIAAGRLFPRLNRIHQVTLEIAAILCKYFYNEKEATYLPEPADKVSFLKSHLYNPAY